jgi:ABC-type sugar transport system ATPase subunit
VVVGIRPESLDLDPNGALSGRVERIEYLGSEVIVTFRLAGGAPLRAALDASLTLPSVGETVGLRFKLGAAHLFDAATGMRLDAELVSRGGALESAGFGSGS